MKNKLFQFLLFFILFFLHNTSFAIDRSITFQQGWNVFSTPNTLSSIEFSNSGSNLTFYKLEGGIFSQVIVSTGSITPLNGYLVNNTSGNSVDTFLTYNSNLTPNQKFHQKSLSSGRNIIGITTTDSPFSTIGNGLTSSVTLTDGIIANKVQQNFSANLQYKYGEAYAVFMSTGALYGGYETYTVENISSTVNQINLSNTSKFIGAQKVTALEFEVTSGNSSLHMTELAALFQSGAISSNSQQILEVSLYKDSVIDSNLLSTISGLNLSSGVANFNGFSHIIGSNLTEKFIITISFNNNISSIANYTTTLQGITLYDHYNNIVNSTGIPFTSSGIISVHNYGEIITLEINELRTENENDKVILAGSSMKVVSYDVKAINEVGYVETVTFAYTGAFNLQTAGTTASLYLGDTLIKTNSNSDLTATTITFNNLTSLIVPTTTSQLKLAINSVATGKDLTGLSGTGFTISSIVLSEVTGSDSGVNVNNKTSTTNSIKIFDVVPATLVVSSNNQFGTNDQQSTLILVGNVGNNVDASGSTLDIVVTSLTFEVTSLTANGTITVRNGNGDQIGSGSVSANGNVIVTLTPDVVGNNNETYEIETTAEAAFRLTKTGVGYDADTTLTGLTTKSTTTLSLGTYASTN